MLEVSTEILHTNLPQKAPCAYSSCVLLLVDKWIGNFGDIRQFRLRSSSVGGRKHCSHQHYCIARAVYLIEIWQLLRLWQPL